MEEMFFIIDWLKYDFSHGENSVTKFGVWASLGINIQVQVLS